MAGYPAAGYLANNFAGYRISGEIENIEFIYIKKIEKFLVFITFLVVHSKFASFIQQFNQISGK